jgi:hypothetical protein
MRRMKRMLRSFNRDNDITVRCESCNTVHTLPPDDVDNPFFCDDFERCVEAKKHYSADKENDVENDANKVMTGSGSYGDPVKPADDAGDIEQGDDQEPVTEDEGDDTPENDEDAPENGDDKNLSRPI